MRPVAIVGAGMIPFGRRDEDNLMDMLAYASLKALDDAGLGDQGVDAVYVANMGAGMLQHQSSVASALVDRLSLMPAAAEAIENGPASGASAIKNGLFAVASGYYDLVLVVGGEKMQKYGVTREQLVQVAIKNQEMGALNPYAHVESRITHEGIVDSWHSRVNNPPTADPLRLYDVCPVSDGAAAVILAPLERAKSFKKTPIVIAGFGQATDTHTLQEREDPTDLKAVTLAAQQAFEMAKLKPSDISLAELHDAFTILEIAESEHVGFFKKGEGGKAVEAGRTKFGGQIPINVSGGLKARGHPVGATGVAQVVDVVWQLRHELPKERQVPNAVNGLTVNFGGFGNNVLSFILRRGDQ
jgi:acetyl-CoA C-acetyltransferase